MFVGTVSCEIEVGKAQSAFRGFRMLLVEPEHKVDWEGPVVAIDTVQARVGDLVVVALAPFGPALDIPADLPVEAAVVAIVRSLSGAVPGGAPQAPREPAALLQTRPPARLPEPVVGEPADVVPRHIRSLMEGAPGQAADGPEGSMDRDDGPRRRRRRRRGGRGRPDHVPETEGEFLEDESRFGPEPAVSEMGPRDEEEIRPEADLPRQGERPARHDQGRGDRGPSRDRHDRPDHRGGREGGGDRDRYGRSDRPPRRDEDRGPIGSPPPREREDRPPPRFPPREDRPAARAPEREDRPAARFPEREDRPAARAPEREDRPAPPPPEREESAPAPNWGGGWREPARAPEPRHEPKPPVVMPEVAAPDARPRDNGSAEGGFGVVWGTEVRRTEGFEVGEGAKMSSGVKRPRRRRGGGK